MMRALRWGVVLLARAFVACGGEASSQDGGMEDGGGNTACEERRDWFQIVPPGASSHRAEHTAVWTGREVIVWGGSADEATNVYLDTGLRIDLETGSVRGTSLIGAPAPRSGHVAAWTGREMLIWGGMGYSTTVPGASDVFADGALYDPEADTWRPMSRDNGPGVRVGYTAVWGGDLFYVWGGTNEGPLDEFFAYHPELDQWQRILAPAPIGPGANVAGVWTGLELVLWGGDYLSSPRGAVYNPASGTWRAISEDGAPSERGGHTLTWVQNVAVAWGGGSATRDPDGGIYDPVKDEWAPLDAVPRGTIPHRQHRATAIGADMVVFGGLDATGGSGSAVDAGGILDVPSRTWEQLPMDCSPTARQLHTLTAVGGGVLVWGGYGNGEPEPEQGWLLTLP